MIPEILELEDGYTPPCIEIKVAGRQMKIYQMTLASLERAAVVIGPYIGDVFQEFMELDIFKNAVKGKKLGNAEKVKAEAQVKDLLRSRFADLIVQIPRIAVQLVACIMNVPEKGDLTEFFWNVMSPDDLFEIVEKLDELNDFTKIGNRLFDLVRYLGKKYGIDISGKVVSKE